MLNHDDQTTNYEDRIYHVPHYPAISISKRVEPDTVNINTFILFINAY